jgi:hypothetical protein
MVTMLLDLIVSSSVKRVILPARLPFLVGESDTAIAAGAVVVGATSSSLEDSAVTISA